MTAEQTHPDGSDPWLDALGEVAREERAALADAVPEAGPLRPLDEAERASIVEAILAGQGRERAAEPEVADGYDGMSDLPLAEAARPSMPGRWGRIAAIGLALAAALAIFALRPTAPDLPAYTLEASAGAQTVRGVEAAAPYTPGTRFRFVLRPASPPAGPVTAAITLRGPDGPVDWRPAVIVGAGGGVKIEGVFDGPLALPPGRYTVGFTVTDGHDTRVIEHHFEITGG